MNRLFFVCYCFIVLGSYATEIADVHDLVKGELKDASVPLSFIDKTFFDKRTGIDFAVIKKFNAPKKTVKLHKRRVTDGVAFYNKYEQVLKKIEQRWGVSPVVLVGVVGIESDYGNFLGSYDTFNSLLTQAARITERSSWAVRELAELLRYCHARSIDPHDLKGSYAGALGYAQFMPSNLNRYGVTFDGAGLSYHDVVTDSLASAANFLVVNGYSEGADSVYASLLAYNPAAWYVDTVLSLSNAIKTVLDS